MPRISRTGYCSKKATSLPSRPASTIPVRAVRIEDMVLVTKDGCRNLTISPKTFDWTEQDVRR